MECFLYVHRSTKKLASKLFNWPVEQWNKNRFIKRLGGGGGLTFPCYYYFYYYYYAILFFIQWDTEIPTRENEVAVLAYCISNVCFVERDCVSSG